MDDLNNRVAWALNYIKKTKGLTNVQLADILGVDKNTVLAYCHKKGIPKGYALSVLVTEFGLSGEWIMAGKGEPFTGAAEQFPEICGPPPIQQDTIQKVVDYVQSHIENPSRVVEDGAWAMYRGRLNVDEAMGKAYIILSENSELSHCLNTIVQQMSAAVKTRDDLKDCHDQLDKMQKRIEELEKKLDPKKPCDGFLTEVKDQWF